MCIRDSHCPRVNGWLFRRRCKRGPGRFQRRQAEQTWIDPERSNGLRLNLANEGSRQGAGKTATEGQSQRLAPGKGRHSG